MKKLMISVMSIFLGAHVAQAVVITGGKESIIIMKDGKPLMQKDKHSFLQDINDFFNNEFIPKYKNEIVVRDRETTPLPAKDIIATYALHEDTKMPGGKMKKVTIYQKPSTSAMINRQVMLKEKMISDIGMFFENLMKEHEGMIQLHSARGTRVMGEEIAAYKNSTQGKGMGRPADMVSVQFIEQSMPSMKLQKPKRARNNYNRMMNNN